METTQQLTISMYTCMDRDYIQGRMVDRYCCDARQTNESQFTDPLRGTTQDTAKVRRGFVRDICKKRVPILNVEVV